MRDVDYRKWADYIEELFLRNSSKPEIILDLGCGTGSFCIEMAGRGYDMIGVDLSSDMLSCAKTKTLDKGFDILYLNQDLKDFELYGTVDAVVSLIDSMNYITYKNDIKCVFKLVKNYLNPGGLFIFDMNSSYKLKDILGDNIFYSNDEDITYIWQNYFDNSAKICTFDLTFFAKEGELYKRFDETHYERAYDTEEMKELIIQSGLKLCSVYGEFGFKAPGKREERIFYVCKKIC
jgi:Predicted methyltransferase (contains TPR repeat)